MVTFGGPDPENLGEHDPSPAMEGKKPCNCPACQLGIGAIAIETMPEALDPIPNYAKARFRTLLEGGPKAWVQMALSFAVGTKGAAFEALESSMGEKGKSDEMRAAYVSGMISGYLNGVAVSMAAYGRPGGKAEPGVDAPAVKPSPEAVDKLLERLARIAGQAAPDMEPDEAKAFYEMLTGSDELRAQAADQIGTVGDALYEAYAQETKLVHSPARKNLWSQAYRAGTLATTSLVAKMIATRKRMADGL